MTMFLAPYTAIADIDGSPLDAGFLFFGEYGKDPELFPVEVFWDADFAVPAAQPIRTRNGYPVRNGSPTKVYLKTAQHSIAIKNRNGAFILVDFKNNVWDASFPVNTIADLLSLKNPKDGAVVYVKGYHAPTNLALAQPYKGGGTRIYVESRKTENDGFLCINGWVLQIVNNEVTPEQAGAKGDGSDDYVPLQKALSIGTPVTLSDTTYCTSKPLWHDSGKVIKGTGYQKTVIEKTTNSSESGLPTVTAFGKTVVQAVDAVLIARAWTQSYNHYSNISGFLLKHSDSLGSIGYGYYAPMFAEAQVQNVRTANCDIGIYSLDAWMIAWTRVTASANRPFVILGGTSNGFHECWATNAKGASSYAFQFENLYYSHMLSCGADFCGTDGNPIKALFRIVNSNITITSCASEVTHAYKFAHLQGADVEFNKFQTMQFYNKYKTSNPVWGDEDALITGRSETRLIIKGCRFQWLNTNLSTSPSYINISDTSTLDYSDTNTTIEVTGVSHSDAGTFGIAYSSVTSVKVDLGNYIFDNGSVRNYYAGDSLQLGLSTCVTNAYNVSYAGSSSNAHILRAIALNSNKARSLGTTSFIQPWGDANSTVADGYPVNGAGWIVAQFGEVALTGNTQTATARLAIRSDSYGAYIQTATGGNGFLDWYELLTSKNTTVDANGFIKKASPIIRLFADHIDLNSEAEAQDITFKKVGIGNYLIKVSSGFSDEGWYIETPKDANGNVLFSVVYTTLDNGDISIKTYKKRFDIETASIVADLEHPIDINEGRWIDIRLNK